VKLNPEILAAIQRGISYVKEQTGNDCTEIRITVSTWNELTYNARICNLTLFGVSVVVDGQAIENNMYLSYQSLEGTRVSLVS
jgi:hypothetical protein